MSVARVDAAQLAAQLAAGEVEVVDIRDALSFQAGHIPGARHLTNDTLRDFLDSTARDRPLVVCCYHGHSSVGAAAFLLEQGYTRVASLDGGFEGWRWHHPVAR